MMEVDVSINGRSILYGRARNTGESIDDGTLYAVNVADLENDNCSDITVVHDRDDGAAELGRKLLEACKEVSEE